MRHLPPATLFVAFTILGSAAAAERRPLVPSDVLSLKDVGDPQLSPDGQWVAFTVRTLRAKEDDADVDVYLVPFAGGDAIRATASDKAESRPRFSPDGRYLAFLSERDGKRSQVYLLDRRGGEAAKLTDYPGSVLDLEWSPDSGRLALVVSDKDPDAPAEDEETTRRLRSRS
jgi:Tol biopolymer transport system component